MFIYLSICISIYLPSFTTLLHPPPVLTPSSVVRVHNSGFNMNGILPTYSHAYGVEDIVDAIIANSQWE